MECPNCNSKQITVQFPIESMKKNIDIFLCLECGHIWEKKWEKAQDTTSKLKPAIWIDMDGTILTHDKWQGEEVFGEPIIGAKEHIDNLAKDFTIIIWTSRKNVNKIKNVLKNHDIYFDYINENPLQPPNTSSKICCMAGLDDRVARFTGDWNEAEKQLREIASKKL
jgi:Zn ribbon nucleic-acid-binding protein